MSCGKTHFYRELLSFESTYYFNSEIPPDLLHIHVPMVTVLCLLNKILNILCTYTSKFMYPVISVIIK